MYNDPVRIYRIKLDGNDLKYVFSYGKTIFSADTLTLDHIRVN